MTDRLAASWYGPDRAPGALDLEPRASAQTRRESDTTMPKITIHEVQETRRTRGGGWLEAVVAVLAKRADYWLFTKAHSR